jgi:Tetratricopeptide repeat
MTLRTKVLIGSGIFIIAAQPPRAIAEESPTPTEPPTSPAVRLQVVPPRSSYQLKNEPWLSGRISSQGKADTFPDTPLGRYQKIVYDTVTSRWHQVMGESTDLVSAGAVRISVIITPTGQIKDLKIIQNSSNEVFANLCARSILETKLPPIPGNVASVLPRQGLSWEMWFTSAGLEDSADHWVSEFERSSQKPLGSPDDVRSIHSLVAEARHGTYSGLNYWGATDSDISEVIVRWKSASEAITRVNFVDASHGALLFVLEKKDTNWVIVRAYHVWKAQTPPPLSRAPIIGGQASQLLTDATLAYSAGEYDRAIDLVDSALAVLKPDKAAPALLFRGRAYLKKGELDKAERDSNEVTDLDPKQYGAYIERAIIYNRKKDQARALRELDSISALKLNKPGSALNGVAWVRATFPEPGLRDGNKATQEALRACEESQWQESDYIDTLAAAYAETGDFERAVKFQEQALGMVGPENPRRQKMESRLALYRDHKPYREDPLDH